MSNSANRIYERKQKQDIKYFKRNSIECRSYRNVCLEVIGANILTFDTARASLMRFEQLVNYKVQIKTCIDSWAPMTTGRYILRR